MQEKYFFSSYKKKTKRFLSLYKQQRDFVCILGSVALDYLLFSEKQTDEQTFFLMMSIIKEDRDLGHLLQPLT